ncbi:hypothetical protein, partial [Kurthia sibirica]
KPEERTKPEKPIISGKPVKPIITIIDGGGSVDTREKNREKNRIALEKQKELERKMKAAERKIELEIRKAIERENKLNKRTVTEKHQQQINKKNTTEKKQLNKNLPQMSMMNNWILTVFGIVLLEVTFMIYSRAKRRS